MKCTHCDSELVPGARFCDSCGAPVAPDTLSTQSVSTSEESLFSIGSAPSNESPYNPPIPTPPYQPPGSTFKNTQASSIPSYSQSAPYTAAVSDEKIMGMPADKMGLISMILGGAGIVLSCVGCGGLLGILGLVAGFLALKTPNRSNATIGLVLSGIGVLLSLIIACIVFFVFMNSSGNGGYYYNY